MLQEARVHETSVFWERALFGPEHFSFVTHIYVTMGGYGYGCAGVETARGKSACSGKGRCRWRRHCLMQPRSAPDQLWRGALLQMCANHVMSGQQVAVTVQRIACKEHIVLATDGKWRMLLGGFVVQTLGVVAKRWSADGGRYKYRTRFLELAYCLASVENARGYSHLIDCFLRAAQATNLPFTADSVKQFHCDAHLGIRSALASNILPKATVLIDWARSRRNLQRTHRSDRHRPEALGQDAWLSPQALLPVGAIDAACANCVTRLT